MDRSHKQATKFPIAEAFSYPFDHRLKTWTDAFFSSEIGDPLKKLRHCRVEEARDLNIRDMCGG